MAMTSRERMLTALENGRPDRLPCQVHNWMSYYLNTYLGGISPFEAYERFGMDYAIYIMPQYVAPPSENANWIVERKDLGEDADGNHHWEETITTPKGTLHHAGAFNAITGWDSEHLLKTEADFALWNEFLPEPNDIVLPPILEARERLGDKGILRGFVPSFGQLSPWQSFCTLFGTEESIYIAMDEPEFLHHALDAMLQKTLRRLALWEGKNLPYDLIEAGGGGASSTVISPDMFREFCLPYDKQQVEALHALDMKVVYHLCGGLMPMLDLVVEMGADALETMTPPSMGGDCDLAEASRRVGDKLAFVGGFDQNAGFEHGTPESARQIVFDCFEATKDRGGYIISPSDHFFHGDPACIQAFVDACRECTY